MINRKNSRDKLRKFCDISLDDYEKKMILEHQIGLLCSSLKKGIEFDMITEKNARGYKNP